MKNNIFKHIFLATTMVVGLVSCEDRELITIDEQAAPIVMDLSKESLVLDSNFPSNPAITVKWSEAEYTVPVEVKYNVEISSKESFDDAQVITTKAQSVTYAVFTTQEMNEAVKKIGLIPYQSQKMFFRVKSFVGTDDLSQTSNITSLMITPYLASPTYEYDDLFLIGNAAVGTWDNNAGDSRLLPLMKTSSATKFTFTGLFKSGADIGFKMIKEKGDWESQFGKGAVDGQLSTVGSSGNLTVPSEGYYTLTVDIEALTYTLEPATNPTKTYSNISVIGTATSGPDIQLTKSAHDPNLWIGTKVNLKTGVFKFRANNSWDVNWGTNAEFFGTGVAGGADIPVSAEWNYDIYFNDATGQYSFIPVQ